MKKFNYNFLPTVKKSLVLGLLFVGSSYAYSAYATVTNEEHGAVYTSKDYNSLTLNKDVQDVLNLIGAPTFTSSFPGKEVTWYYQNYQAQTITFLPRYIYNYTLLAVTFGQDSKVIKVELRKPKVDEFTSTKYRKDRVELGRRLTIIEQLTGNIKKILNEGF